MDLSRLEFRLRMVVSEPWRALFFGALLALGSCDHSSSDRRPECGGVPDEFFGRSGDVIAADFASRPIEQKYAIYICGNRRVHPPTIWLASEFARDGRVAMPLLRANLFAATDDETIRDIVMVFGKMSFQKSYDVRNDLALMAEIHRKVSGMRDPFWREFVSAEVTRIENPGRRLRQATGRDESRNR